MLAHLPYFEELAALEESNPDWKSAAAGLVVLRLLDSWEQTRSSAVVRGSMLPVRTAIRAMPDLDTAKPILNGILDVITKSSPPLSHDLSARLLAYAKTLEHEERWMLAGDVFETIATHVDPAEDIETAVHVGMRVGFAARMSGDLDRALASYQRVRELAITADLQPAALEAQLGEARVIAERGNLPRAAKLINRVVREAENIGAHDVAATALHGSAYVAHLRGQYERAVCFAHRALVGTTEADARERILADMAASFAEMGAFDVARDAHEVIAATANSQHVRWQAQINLLEIAAIRRQETVFQRYRIQLKKSPLPPRLEAYYELYSGIGFARLGNPKSARASLQRAMEIASANQLNQVLFDSETQLSRLTELAAEQAPEITPPRSGEVLAIGERIREMRAEALA